MKAEMNIINNSSQVGVFALKLFLLFDSILLFEVLMLGVELISSSFGVSFSSEIEGGMLYHLNWNI